VYEVGRRVQSACSRFRWCTLQISILLSDLLSVSELPVPKYLLEGQIEDLDAAKLDSVSSPD
jgi:hypothetical protein